MTGAARTSDVLDTARDPLTRAEFRAAMVAAAVGISGAEILRRCDGALSKSTVYNYRRPDYRRLPEHREMARAWFVACGLEPRDVMRLVAAWDRLTGNAIAPEPANGPTPVMVPDPVIVMVAPEAACEPSPSAVDTPVPEIVVARHVRARRGKTMSPVRVRDAVAGSLLSHIAAIAVVLLYPWLGGQSVAVLETVALPAISCCAIVVVGGWALVAVRARMLKRRRGIERGAAGPGGVRIKEIGQRKRRRHAKSSRAARRLRPVRAALVLPISVLLLRRRRAVVPMHQLPNVVAGLVVDDDDVRRERALSGRASDEWSASRDAAAATAAAVGEALVGTVFHDPDDKYMPEDRGTVSARFVEFAFRKAGIEVPKTVFGQSAIGIPVLLGDLARGDLIVIHDARGSCSGIYAGNERVVLAPEFGAPVTYRKLDRTVSIARRCLLADESATPATEHAGWQVPDECPRWWTEIAGELPWPGFGAPAELPGADRDPLDEADAQPFDMRRLLDEFAGRESVLPTAADAAEPVPVIRRRHRHREDGDADQVTVRELMATLDRERPLDIRDGAPTT
ncbi:hypothetical protein [Nocardia arthritidis]|uniref:NlpC/P60 domain-containing protein n=1 Tax=Nocardia arthritidis TaxID=228602 RepID=A0A6G9YI62_9NOCA|nr:hypothetical protein [Nocardia arthritidis]QIS12633.1 hypothetical protein F5544_23875 [Nocardia arthritidis]